MNVIFIGLPEERAPKVMVEYFDVDSDDQKMVGVWRPGDRAKSEKQPHASLLQYSSAANSGWFDYDGRRRYLL
jgi:hypothetical protein